MLRLRYLVACLALAACTERPEPGDTDTTTGTGTTTTAGTTAISDSDPAATVAPMTTDAVPDWHAGACKPVDGGACPMGHVCCSDDPATVGGLLPNYYQDGAVDDVYGTPLFSDENNDLSHWGYCIDTGEFPSPLANGCPVPCNPTWSAGQIATICGGSQCCPFTAVDPLKDCIMDPNTGRWRTARGADIIAKLTAWGSQHATNQDPLADSCKVFAGDDQDKLIDCVTQLTVADQRGFCFAAACPCVEDVCDQKNPDYVPRCP